MCVCEIYNIENVKWIAWWGTVVIWFITLKEQTLRLTPLKMNFNSNPSKCSRNGIADGSMPACGIAQENDVCQCESVFLRPVIYHAVVRIKRYAPMNCVSFNVNCNYISIFQIAMERWEKIARFQWNRNDLKSLYDEQQSRWSCVRVHRKHTLRYYYRGGDCKAFYGHNWIVCLAISLKQIIDFNVWDIGQRAFKLWNFWLIFIYWSMVCNDDDDDGVGDGDWTSSEYWRYPFE